MLSFMKQNEFQSVSLQISFWSLSVEKKSENTKYDAETFMIVFNDLLNKISLCIILCNILLLPKFNFLGGKVNTFRSNSTQDTANPQTWDL